MWVLEHNRKVIMSSIDVFSSVKTHVSYVF